MGLGLFIASAGDLFAMRCGNALVLTGDREFEVLNKCGEPDFVAIDGWAYNFGPNLFIHYLRFDNGRLTEIELRDYGWDDGGRGGPIWHYMGSIWQPPAPPGSTRP